MDNLTTSAAATSAPGLTFEGLVRMLDEFRLAHSLIYATQEAVSTGKVFRMAGTDYSHEFFIFHDEAEAQALADRVGLQLLHVRDAPRKPLSGLLG